ncbi:MAG: hypothetical protein KF752_01580 [Pirellulaceae bacterium]|nr:hypothetical protein [Pirellulaceae bacterium]
MKNLNELVLLLPSYELEGYPRSLPSDQAAQVLSGWVALWHPALLGGAGRIPRWHQAGRLPTQLEAVLFVLPPISVQALDATAAERIAAAGGLLLEPCADWREFQSQILRRFPQVHADDSAESLADNMAIEFAALGYAYLQVQLMTRQLRYTSNLDVALFEEQVLKSVDAVLAGDQPTAQVRLQSCFDTLGQERDHYYSNDVHLLDLTLLAESTLGRSLGRQLCNPQPTNLIACADLLSKLREKSTENFCSVQQRLADGTLYLAGGLDRESPAPLEPLEAAVRALQRAPQAYRDLQVAPPQVFARLTFGLQAEWASLLKHFDFQGALLLAFTGGSYPTADQPKISWEAQDGSRIPALLCPVLDASDPASFHALGWTVGEALDRQHVPTLVLAHWPDTVCPFAELLTIVASKTPALGKWSLLGTYFQQTEDPYHHQRLAAEGFHYNWLAESESPSPLILAVKQMHKLQSRARSLQNIANLIWQLRHIRSKPDQASAAEAAVADASFSTLPISVLSPQLNDLLTEIDQWLVDPVESCQRYVSLHSQAGELSQRLLQELAGLLVGNSLAPMSPGTGGEASQERSPAGRADVVGGSECKLLFNPRCNPVRVQLHTSADLQADATESWHFASGLVGRDRVTCVDLPSMGFVATPLHESKSVSTPDKFVLADAAGLLRNEFIEAQVDLRKGHIRSLHVPAKRGNRLSLMVAYREKQGQSYQYSDMVAREVSLLTCSNMSGMIRSRGWLSWRGENVGDFEIDYEIRRGSRLISATVSLSQLRSAQQRNPWLSGYVLRWAWPSEAARLRAYQGGKPVSWSGGKTISPELIDIDEGEYVTHLLTGGLAFHTRQDMRFGETLLAGQGHTSVRHRVGLAVDLPHPLPNARQLMDKPYQVALKGNGPSTSGWLMSMDAMNVEVNLECPLLDSAQQNAGLRVVVSEQAGKSTTARLRLFRDASQAHRVDYLGHRLSRLTVSPEGIVVALRANDTAVVDILW